MSLQVLGSITFQSSQSETKDPSTQQRDEEYAMTTVPTIPVERIYESAIKSETSILMLYDDDVKMCRLYQVLDDKLEFLEVCGCPIGQGNTLCVNHKCTTMNHKQIKVRNILPENLYVM